MSRAVDGYAPVVGAVPDASPPGREDRRPSRRPARRRSHSLKRSPCSRSTSRSARRQSIWCQSELGSSGPLTPPASAGAASSLSVGSEDVVIFLITDPPDHVSPRHPRAGSHRTRYPASYPPRSVGGLIHRDRSCCLSATGIRLLVTLRPPRRSAFLTVSPPAHHRPGPGRGFHVPHAQDATGEGALYSPGTVVLIQTGHDHRPAPGASQRHVPAPRHNLHHCAAPLDEPSTRVQAIRPSDLPLARDQRMDRQPSGFPRAPHPAITHSARRGGDGSD
jgi:hypothetical protein